MSISIKPGTRVRNALRGLLQVYGTESIKRRLWNLEFSRGRWDCLDATPGDCVYSYVEKYANKGCILDLGCGSGSTANELDAAAYERYIGVDVSEVALEKAARRSRANGRADNSEFVRSDISSYIPRRHVDVILFRDSLYYLPHTRIKAVLDRYSHFLNEGGVFVVRMLYAGDRYKGIVDTIESDFEVVDRHRSDQPKALVTVFRARPGTR